MATRAISMTRMFLFRMSQIAEEWRIIPSFPRLEASSWGRVRPIPRVGRMPYGGTRQYNSEGTYGVTRRAKKNARHSYRGTTYPDIGNVKIHRLVCEAFHGPAPFPRAVVIHINEDAHDNRPGNLKWGTQKENLNSPGFLKYCCSRTGANSPTVKARRTAT